MRIGVVSDTHSAGRGLDLPVQALEALAGVDLILHCGDLECLGVLDYLETVAPVLAVRGYEDPVEPGRGPGQRLASPTRVVKAGGVNIGMVHDIQWPGPRVSTTADGSGLVFPQPGTRELLDRKFGQRVDVVLFGDTHRELVWRFDGVLLVNPGSPTYPARRRPGVLGTVGLLEISGGAVTAELMDLPEEHRVPQQPGRGPGP